MKAAEGHLLSSIPRTLVSLIYLVALCRAHVPYPIDDFPKPRLFRIPCPFEQSPTFGPARAIAVLGSLFT